MKLVIVESPAKCKKIEKFLGSGYKCCASFGHICGIKDGLKGINTKNDYKPTYTILSAKQKYVRPLRQKIRNATEIILATDDDREGEAIAWHICQVFKLSIATTKRIIFHEITKKAVVQAVQNPTRLDMDKVQAQQARQILDLIVGFRLSPLLWKHIGRNTKAVLSAGRCQTPALRLVYDNQQEINNAPGKAQYDTRGIFTEKNIQFHLHHFYESKEDVEEFLTKSVNHDHVYKSNKPRKTTKKPPLPFTTSTLQQKSSNILHYSPKNTMKLAQKLYEGGYITYMRTDSRTYSKIFLTTAKKYIKQTYGDEYLLSTIDKHAMRGGKAGAQEAHEAIRPTVVDRKDLPTNVDVKQKRLYRLIWQNTVESCMAAATYFSLRATVTAANKREFRHSCEQVDFPGWKVVGGYEKENTMYVFLQSLKNGTVLPYNKITSNFSLRELKTHYTEARLVQVLEAKGIGRPSTFSSLISKIQERKYVLKEDVKGKKLQCVDFVLKDDTIEENAGERVFGGERNKLVIQPIGVLVLEFLLKHFEPMFKYEYTKRMEDALDKIAGGEKVWHTLCREGDTGITILSKKIDTDHREMIRIDENHTYMIGRYGPVIRCDKDGETTFLSVKKNIDMKKLQNGSYSLEELKSAKSKEKILGNYQGQDVLLKNGKFGLYISCNGKNHSVKSLNKRAERITFEDVEGFLSGTKSGNPNILRILRKDLSVRKGKWGNYIFYKTESMKRPHFP